MLKVEPIGNKDGIRKILANHFALRIFREIAVKFLSESSAVEFSRDVDFWKAILKRSLLPGTTIQLMRFHIMEWFPRVPGLYHHPKSKAQRATALEFVDSILSKELDEKYSGLFANAAPSIRANIIYRYSNIGKSVNIRALVGMNNRILLDESFSEIDSTIVFDPHGKQTMLQSGVGSVRLQSLEINGESCWLCSASSLGWADQGIPLVVPDLIFRKIFSEVRDTGCVLADVTGELRFVSQHAVTTLTDLYNTASGIPHAYVYVTHLGKKYPQGAKSEELKACAAVTFVSNYEGELERTYATYVGFNPAIADDLDNAVDWMSDKYVASRYSGRIITDFDEQIPRFSNVLFSLEYINSNLELDKVERKFHEIGIKTVPKQIKQYIRIEHLHGSVNDMTSNIDISGTAGIVAGGSVTNTGQVTVSHVAGIAPDSLEALLKPFDDALGASNLSATHQALIKAQLSVLREEATKASESRNKTTISNALDGLKGAAEVASVLKIAWEMFGQQLAAWFQISSSGTTI